MKDWSFDDWLRAVMWTAVLVVAGIAGVVSYAHIFGLAFAHGQTGVAARLLPISVDGTILASSVVLLHEARANRGGPWEAWMMLTLGIAATLAANVGFGVTFGVVGALVSAWPAVALIGVVEVGMALMRRHARAQLAKEESEPAGISTTPDLPALTEAELVDPRSLAVLCGRAEEIFAESVRESSTPTIRDIRSALNVGQPRAEQIQAHLNMIIRRRLDEERAILNGQLT